MTLQTDLLDERAVFRRIRNSSRSGRAGMSLHDLRHQMGRPGPYGWREQRIDAAFHYLVKRGHLQAQPDGRYAPTDKGIRHFEGQP